MKQLIRKFLSATAIIAMFFSFTLTLNPAGTSAASTYTDSGLPIRTAREVASMWQNLMHPAADFRNPYITKPATATPYTPGTLRPDYIQDGLNAVNFYRFISGLPYDITTTAALNLKAQHGSVLLAAGDEFSHTPAQPADMANEFYKIGYGSTSSANIYGSYGYVDHIMARSIDAYMEDSDTYNLDRVGHRRWILNPPLKQVGLGLADSKTKWTYSALQVFDVSRSGEVDYRYIAYPAPGPIPNEVFESYYAWSVSINPDEYATPAQSQVSVTVKRERDGRTWELDAGVSQVTAKGAYFNVENSHYGTGPAIIFRPDGIDEYRDGDRYEVTVNGLKTRYGAQTYISYAVDFISAKKYLAPPVTESAPSPIPLPDLITVPGPTQKPEQIIKFKDTSTHWARLAIDWAVKNKIVTGYPNGTFQPDTFVTEEEFLKMYLEALDVSVPSNASGRWSNSYYTYAAANKLTLRGSVNTKARTMPINRLAVAELIASFEGSKLTGSKAIQFVLDNGYSKGKTSKTVNGYAGADKLSRAEAVQFIKNIIDVRMPL
ncbi:CAP and S-layer homology domain-containing protein [Cohnella kolymensis]|uniref:CAP and S-layer homology domain-containing protein n=1 Tax=Cohnella kolymensis TaxID=1590652 RepID=UPI0013792D97|nr:S-layer homology domain-containing protein [Cohnella kolymensis]